MSERYVEMVAELQRRVDLLHVLAGIEVPATALGAAMGAMEAALGALDSAADGIVRSSGMTVEEWYEQRFAENERERLATQREKARARRERKKRSG